MTEKPTVMKRGLKLVIVTLFIALPISFIYLRPTEEVKRVTAMVEEADVEESVLADGTLEGKMQVDVGAQASGQIKSMLVRLGDKVKKGQLLAEIDPTIAINELKEQQSRARELGANKDQSLIKFAEAEATLRRQKMLLAADATSRQEYLRAQTEFRSLKAQVWSMDAALQSVQTKVEKAQAFLAFTKIVAPSDGEVVAILTREGQTVNANQETPIILKLADLDTMTINTQISEADVHRVRIGQTACFATLGEPEKQFCGELRSIEPAPRGFLDSHQQRGNTGEGGSSKQAVFYNALFDIPNPEHKLRIGMTAQVSVVTSVARKVLTIPSQAIGPRTPSGRFEVDVINDKGKLDRRSVRLGLNNGVRAEILDGLQVGDEVLSRSGPTSTSQTDKSTTDGA